MIWISFDLPQCGKSVREDDILTENYTQHSERMQSRSFLSCANGTLTLQAHVIFFKEIVRLNIENFSLKKRQFEFKKIKTDEHVMKKLILRTPHRTRFPKGFIKNLNLRLCRVSY